MNGTNEVPWLRNGVGRTPADGGCVLLIEVEKLVAVLEEYERLTERSKVSEIDLAPVARMLAETRT